MPCLQESLLPDKIKSSSQLSDWLPLTMGKRKAAEEEEVENEQPSWDRVEMERGGQPAEKRLRYYI